MILKYSVINEKYSRTHHHEIELKGYWNTDEVIRDFEKVIEFHKLKCKEYKKNYADNYGKDLADEMFGEE